LDRIIEVKVAGNHLTKDNKNAGVQHEANATAMRIEFDASWEGYAKKVTFWDAKGLNPVERTLTADLLEDITKSILIYIVPIPGEPMREAGELTFVIDGWEDGKRQRSLSDKLTVKPAPFIEQADQPVDPTPTQAEQLQKQIDTLLGDMQEQAIIALTAASEAKVSEEAAAQSAAEAAYSAAEAATEARNVVRYADAAEQNATKAEANANIAVSAASRAGSSATTAVQSANAAKVSEDNAKASEDNAKASEVASGLNQANAQSSEENAVLQSQNALRYATEALASKNTAVSSALAAQAAKTAALAAQVAAEKARDEAVDIVGGDFATKEYVDEAVANASGDIDGGTF